jgi:Uma2 family endonuclease
MNTSVQQAISQFSYRDYHPGLAEIFAKAFRTPNYQSIPDMQRQAISLRIAAALLEHVESEKLGCVLQAPCGIILSRKLIRPDILYVARERRGIIGESNLHAAPDLIVEVLSTAKREKYLRSRRCLYASLGVKEYWIVYPDIFAVEAMIWSELGFVSAGVYGKNDLLCSQLLPKFRLPLSSVFPLEDE